MHGVENNACGYRKTLCEGMHHKIAWIDNTTIDNLQHPGGENFTVK